MSFESAKALIEKKKTIAEGMAQLQLLIPDVTPETVDGMMEAVKRCKIVVVSRHDKADVFDGALAIIAATSASSAVSSNTTHVDNLSSWKADLLAAHPNTPAAPTTVQPDQIKDLAKLERDYMMMDMMAQLGVPVGDTPQSYDTPQDFLDALEEGLSANPASRKAMRELTYFKVPRDAPENEYSCVVCLEDLKARTHARKMPCKHLFHDDCLLDWLKKNNTCPTCRFALPKQEKIMHLFGAGDEAAAAADEERKAHSSTMFS